ncbi:MAG: tripartite tricarboxylate transporter permease [Dehalococcoidia bacterium]
MFEAFVQGFAHLFAQPETILLLCLGVLAGIVLGITPGVGGLLGVSLALGLIRGMDPAAGLLILMGIYSAVMTGGTLPAVLMNVPGSVVNAATIADGYPMAQRGEGARALGAAFTSSALGGIVGVVFALLMLPVIVPLVLALRPPELALLMLLGLSFLASLGGGEARMKNLMVGMLGILVSLIGVQPSTGLYRYTFGSHHLFPGISLLVIALGIFGMGEMMDLFLKGSPAISALEKTKVKLRDTFEGVKDVFRNWWLWLRCSVIGYVIGVIPAIGGATSTFVAYGYGNKASKHPEQWGKGCVEGVIAPEAANNAGVGGALLTTMAFGIPGDSVLALILGALLIFGIVPGRALLTESPDLVFTVLIGIALANILAVLFMLPGISHLTKITATPFKFIFSIVLALIAASAFTADRAIMHVFLLIPFGVLGVCMKSFGYSLPCFLLGFILGGIFEHYLWLALIIRGPLFFLSSPISIALILVIIASFAVSPLKSALIKARGKISAKRAGDNAADQRNRKALGDRGTTTDELQNVQSRPSLGFLVFLIIVAVVFLVYSLTYGPLQAKVVGIFASTVVIVLGLIQLTKAIRSRKRVPPTEEEPQRRVETATFLRRAGILALWVGGFTMATYLLGFLISIPLFVLSYLKWRHTGWLVSIITAVATTAAIYGLFEVFLLRRLWQGLLPLGPWLIRLIPFL